MADMKNEARSSSGISESVISDFGRRKTPCRYCKTGTFVTNAISAQSLTVYDCQALIDSGWTRLGSSLWKPEMENTCCPCYTIRVKASSFVPSNVQAEVLKRMQRFLDGSPNVKKPDDVQMSNIYKTMTYLSNQIDSVVRTCTELGEFPSDVKFSKASVKSVAPNKRIQAEGTQDLLYTSKISFQIAADITRANKSISTGKDPRYTAQVLSSHLENMASDIGFLVKSCNGHVNFYSAAQADLVDGRPAVSKDSSSTDSVKKQNLEIRLRRSSFDPEEYELYRRYVIFRHNHKPDHVTESSYKRLYCDSPLIYVPSSGDSSVPPCGFGTFHQQYLINGKLVAVVVLDILPECISSKYLFYDPDRAFLSLGKYVLLQGINWVKETQSYCPSLQYSNLGIYIHSIDRMKYKAEYGPSELLCPRRYQWVSFDIAKRLLDKNSYVVLSDFATSQNEAPASPKVIDDQIEQENESFSDESNEIAFEDSGDSSGPETTNLMSAETREDVSHIVTGLKELHLKDKFNIHQRIQRLMEGLLQVTLEGKTYSCKDCKTHLALCDDIVSKEFYCNNGKAYLFTKVVNVTVGIKEERMMMTGLHIISDIFCIKCGSNVGWTYETVHEENQKYMEGKSVGNLVQLWDLFTPDKGLIIFTLLGTNQPTKSVLERFKLSGPDEINDMVSHNTDIGGSDQDDV